MRYRVELTRVVKVGQCEMSATVALEEGEEESGFCKAALEVRTSSLLDQEMEKVLAAFQASQETEITRFKASGQEDSDGDE